MEEHSIMCPYSFRQNAHYECLPSPGWNGLYKSRWLWMENSYVLSWKLPQNPPHCWTPLFFLLFLVSSYEKTSLKSVAFLPPLSSLSHASIIYPGLLPEPASWALHPLQAGLYRGWTFKMDVWSWTSRSHCLPACHSCPLTQLYGTKSAGCLLTVLGPYTLPKRTSPMAFFHSIAITSLRCCFLCQGCSGPFSLSLLNTNSPVSD